MKLSCQTLFYAASPTKRIPSGTAFYLCAIYKYRFVVCFSLLFQQIYILVKQILCCIGAAACSESGYGCMIRNRLLPQQPHEVHSVSAGFLQLPAGIDPTLVSVDHYLEQHSRVDLRFSAFHRIGAIQFRIIQSFKLGACQSDGCVLRQ